MLSLILAAATFAPQGPGSPNIVINEFSYDDAGVDDFEFVELYNRGAVPVDISGWKVVCRDSGSPTFGGAGADPTQTIPAGTIIAPGGFYLLGNAALVPVPVPGVSQQMPANSLENGNGTNGALADTIEVWDTTNAIIDSVVYEMGGQLPFGPFPIEGNGF